jgi:nucleoside-diphosphate-sugar epimerase
MKVLVTGHDGYIGRVLLPVVRAANCHSTYKAAVHEASQA